MQKMYKYPIKVVSQMTGLSVFVIRAWEKRYDAVVPSRTETNRRLYSDEDIEKLKLLNEAIKKGHNIGSVAGLTINELQSVLGSNLKNQTSNQNVLYDLPADSKLIIDECIDTIKSYDGTGLEKILLKASSKMSQPHLIENLIIPLVYKIGDMWQDGQLRVGNEHLSTAVIRSFLSGLIERHIPAKNAPIFISATPTNQEHELGAMIAGVVAASAGWKVVYLGSNLPVEEIAAAAGSLDAKIVALSIVYPNDDPHLKKNLVNLKKMLPEEAAIIIGGRAVNGYLDVLDEISAVVVKDTYQLKTELEAIRNNKYN